MNKNLIYLISIPYFIIAVVVILSRILKIPELENMLRPILMLILMMWYLVGSYAIKSKINWFFIITLLFSLLGDIFRMPLINNFIAGLSFFILAHLLYSCLFLWESRGRIIESISQGWLFLVIMFLILSSLLVSLLPPIIRHDLYIQLTALPILIIALYILILSTYVYSQVYDNIFGKFVMLGGIFFLVSDSFLAINRFSIDVRLSSVWVLSFYVIAQWMLVYGYMNSKKKVKDFYTNRH